MSCEHSEQRAGRGVLVFVIRQSKPLTRFLASLGTTLSHKGRGFSDLPSHTESHVPGFSSFETSSGLPGSCTSRVSAIGCFTAVTSNVTYGISSHW